MTVEHNLEPAILAVSERTSFPDLQDEITSQARLRAQLLRDTGYPDAAAELERAATRLARGESVQQETDHSYDAWAS
jgi:hypothetical protein